MSAATAANTQVWANANGTCTGTQYWNTAQSASNYQRNNCAACYTGSWPTYTVPAGTYSSCISQADANSQALTAATAANTQAWANANGTCSFTGVNSTDPTGATASVNPTCGGATTLSVIGGSLGTGASWQWYVGACGGGNIGSGSSLIVSPASTTIYWVRAQGTCNTTACASVTVTVNSIPSAPTASATDITCSSYTATWTTSSGATYYLLDLGNDCDGWTTLDMNVGNTTSYFYSTPIPSCDYFFRVRAANSCGISGYSNQPWVTPPCCTNPAAVTVSGGGTFCNSATLTASGGAGGTIYWQGTTSNGTSTATPSTSQVVTSSGTYYFRSYNSASGGCWGPEGSATVTINTTPAQPGPISGATSLTTCNAGCARYELYSVTNDPAATSYSWWMTPVDGTWWSGCNCVPDCSDTDNSAKICLGENSNGAYTINVTASNACGTSPVRTLAITKAFGPCPCP